MNERVGHWIQIVTGIALVIGLALVFVELRQAKILSFAELTSEGFAERMEDNRAVVGEDSAATFARACFDPKSLTDEDLVILNAHFENRAIQISRLRVLEVIADYGVPWRDIAAQVLAEMMMTEHGRWWFRERLAADAELNAIGAPMLESPVDCATWLGSFRGADAPSGDRKISEIFGTFQPDENDRD